ncbi:MAG: FmdB family zinc ribbon protein [Luteimonas sp.]
MPIYAFQCTSCSHQFDRLQKMSDPDPDACPECAADAVKRQLTAPSFRLSGSGWYETDFKKDGEKKRNLAGAGDARPGGDKPDAAPAKAEPAKKAEPKPAAETP